MFCSGDPRGSSKDCQHSSNSWTLFPVPKELSRAKFDDELDSENGLKFSIIKMYQ